MMHCAKEESNLDKDTRFAYSPAFFSHFDFLLPLCLKSIVMRVAMERSARLPFAKGTLDDDHVLLFQSMVKSLVRGLMITALGTPASGTKQDTSLRKAMEAARVVVDFLIGLLSVIDTKQVGSLIEVYFAAFRDAEDKRVGATQPLHEDVLRQVKWSRQLRLCAIEALAVLPCFITLNCPMKFSAYPEYPRMQKPSWLHQSAETHHDILTTQQESGSSGWLAQIVLNESLSICSLSSEAVLDEAISHIELSESHAISTPSALKNRRGTVLHRGDLLDLQSIAIHAITVVYELVIRRHALDQRFQSESSRRRVAGVLALPILAHSLHSTRWLAKMEATHKIRSVWLLCFVYVLQDAPEALLYDFLRSCCTSSVRLVCVCSMLQREVCS
jgi:hypothetical protein